MRHLVIHQQFFSNSDCYKAGITQAPAGVQVHSTGANNPYLKRYVQPNDGLLGYNSYQNDHNHPNVNVCANAYIGKLESGEPTIYQTLPWNYRCWLSGSSTKGNANKLGYIGFEICEDNLNNKDYFNKVVMELSVNLVAYLCIHYGLSVSSVRDHNELHGMGLASNHGDITHWLKKYGLTMNDYRAAVSQAVADGVDVEYITQNKVEPTPAPTPAPAPEKYRARVTVDNEYPVKMRAAPSTTAKILNYLPAGTIVDVLDDTNSTWYQISFNNVTGYMMSDFLEKVDSDKQQSPIDTEDVINKSKLLVIKEKLVAVLSDIDNMLKEE